MQNQSPLPNWMSELLDLYRSQLILSKSKPTVDAYTHDIASFLKYMHMKGVRRAAHMKEAMIISYLGHHKSLGKSDSSLNRYYMSIRSFCRFLRRIKALPDDISLDVSAPRCIQKAPVIPSLSEMDSLLDLEDSHSDLRLRDKAILELLYSSGLRASELCDLTLADYCGHQVTIKRGKRGKTRTVPITPSAHESLSQYIEHYRGIEPGPLFTTVTGRKMTRQVLSKMVARHTKRAGIQSCTTHTLRHACATHLLEKGADLRLIQEVLGHSSIASTQRYTHLSSTKMQDMFKQFHPRGM